VARSNRGPAGLPPEAGLFHGFGAVALIESLEILTLAIDEACQAEVIEDWN
jgi:hypothetical protein